MKNPKYHFVFVAVLLVGLFAFSSLGRDTLTILRFVLPEKESESGYLSPTKCNVTTNGVFCFSLPPGIPFYDANCTDYRNLGYVSPEDAYVNVYKIYVVLEPKTVHSMIRFPNGKPLTYPGYDTLVGSIAETAPNR